MELGQAENLEYVINAESLDLARRLATAIDGNTVAEKTRLIGLLKSLCLHSSEGHRKALEILEKFQELKSRRYRFGILVDELSKVGSIGYRSSLLASVNALIDWTGNLDDRIRIRNEFIGLKLLEILKDIRKETRDNATIAELERFEKSQLQDDDQAPRVEGVDLTSHLDVFNAVLKQVLDSPQNVQFLSILRHMLQLDPSESLSDVAWNVLDKFVTRVTLLDKETDAERVLLDGVRRLDRAVLQSKYACSKDCRCSCHICGTSFDSHPSSPLSPSARRRLESTRDKETYDNCVTNGVTVPQAPPPPPPPPPIGFNIPPPPAPAQGSINKDGTSTGAPLNGVPPPPPAPLPVIVKLPQQMVPEPKSKLKKFQWNKISADKVVGKKNVWTAVGDKFSEGCNINFSEVDELFGVRDSQVTIQTNGDNGSREINNPTDRKKKSDEVNLLDGKRSLNVNIFLRQFRVTHTELIRCLETGKGELVSPETLRGFLKIVPEADELNLLRTYQGDIARLGNAEKFYLELMSFPNYKLHADALLVKEEFSQGLDWIKPCIDAIILTAKDIKESTSVQQIIYLVLVTGNYLNSGAYVGDAAGFRLNSLLKLTETKANKPGVTLLHYVVNAAFQQNPKLLNLAQELKYLKEASQYSVDSLMSDILNLKEKIKSISEQIEQAEPNFRNVIKAFLQSANREMKMLDSDLKEMETLRLQLVDYFCEDEKQFKLDECFKIFNTFCERFAKAVQENEQKMRAEEKAAERKQEQDKVVLRRPASTVAEDNVDGSINVSEKNSRRSSDACLLDTTTRFDFSRLDPLRNSSGSRRNYESKLDAGSKDDRRLRRSMSGNQTDDLMDFLNQPGDEGNGNFERVGSVRRRRRPRTPLENVVNDRERTAPLLSTGGSSVVQSACEEIRGRNGENYGESRLSPSVDFISNSNRSSTLSSSGQTEEPSKTLSADLSRRLSAYEASSDPKSLGSEKDRRHLERLRRGRADVTAEAKNDQMISSEIGKVTSELTGICDQITKELATSKSELSLNTLTSRHGSDAEDHRRWTTIEDTTRERDQRNSSSEPVELSLTERALLKHSSKSWRKSSNSDITSESSPPVELSPTSRRWGKVFDDDRSDASTLQRTSTLPRRWQNRVSLLGSKENIIDEDGGEFNVVTPSSLSYRQNKPPVNGTVEHEEVRFRNSKKDSGLANHDREVAPSPTSSRGSGQYETDSGRDEGFESERASMCSTIGSEAGHMAQPDHKHAAGNNAVSRTLECDDESRHSGDLPFARSIDSLITKPELVLTAPSIDIECDNESSPSAYKANEEIYIRRDVPTYRNVDSNSTSSSGKAPTGKQSMSSGPQQGRPRSSFGARSTVSDITERLSQPKRPVAVTNGTNHAKTSTNPSSKAPPTSKPIATSSPSQFVRGAKLRTTMPASLANRTSSRSPSSTSSRAAASTEQEVAPEPPRRTSSMSTSERLTMGLPPSSSRRSTASVSSSNDGTPSAPMKRPSRLASTFLPSSAARPKSAREDKSAERLDSGTKSKPPSLFKKILDHKGTPRRDDVVIGHRTQRLSSSSSNK